MGTMWRKSDHDGRRVRCVRVASTGLFGSGDAGKAGENAVQDVGNASDGDNE